MSAYTDEGFKNRGHYLECIAHDFGLDPAIVYGIASILGPSEDFDGLLTALEDAADEISRKEIEE